MWGGVEARALARRAPMSMEEGSTSPSQLVEEDVDVDVEKVLPLLVEGHLGQSASGHLMALAVEDVVESSNTTVFTAAVELVLVLALALLLTLLAFGSAGRGLPFWPWAAPLRLKT